MKFLHVVFHFIHLRILEELFWNLWWRKENMRQLPGLQRFFLWLHVLVLMKPCCQLIIVKPFFLKFCLCRLCIKVLSDDKKLWEDEVYKFARKHQLEVNILSFSIFTGRFKISLSYPWFYLFSLSGYRPLYSYQSSEAELSNLWNGSVWLPQERCQGIHPTTLSSYCSCWSCDFDYPIRDQQEHLQSCELMSIWD